MIKQNKDMNKLTEVMDMLLQGQLLLPKHENHSEEEALALDDYVTNNEITLGPNGSGWLSRRELRISGLSNVTVNYLLVKAKADHKTPIQIIDELVGKELIAAAI